MSSLLPPINFNKWVEENKASLLPPVGNKMVYSEGDFLVMAIGGPNARTDYHVEEGPEWFYQVKGDMVLKVVVDGEFKDIPIKEGEMFMLPANIPHSPQRFKDTVGLVIERNRDESWVDKLRWYCENTNCLAIVNEEGFHCKDLGSQLKPVIEAYYADVGKRTCKKCGHVNRIPKLED